jgi:hypothetical protein
MSAGGDPCHGAQRFEEGAEAGVVVAFAQRAEFEVEPLFGEKIGLGEIRGIIETQTTQESVSRLAITLRSPSVAQISDSRTVPGAAKMPEISKLWPSTVIEPPVFRSFSKTEFAPCERPS